MRLIKLSRRIVNDIQFWRRDREFENKLENISKNMSDGYIRSIVEQSLDYVESLRINGTPYGRYRYTRGGQYPLLYASVFAALFRHLLGDLDQLTLEKRGQWIDYINGHQCKDGLFRDYLVVNEIAETEDWWGWRHLTLHCSTALAALGGRSVNRFQFIKSFLSIKYTKEWLDQLDWGEKVAFTSNTVQNYATAMQFTEYFWGDKSYKKTLKFICKYLFEKSCSKTGLWGFPEKSKEDLSQAVQAAYHFYLVLDWEGIVVPNKTEAIQMILRTQNKLGGFSPCKSYSSACEDIDSIDPLVRFGTYTGMVKEISDALQKALPWVLANFNREDGGAVFTRHESFFYGHLKMSTQPNESSLFATWFRLLSIAFIEACINKNKGKYFHFLDAPGHQFLKI